MANALWIFKALHVVGFVAWFAGLFYLVRILVYHVEAFEKEDPEKSILIKQFNLMEWRVYKVICNPAMMITWTFGLGMLFLQKTYLELGWMHLKITLVFLLTVYHVYTKIMIKKMEKGEKPLSSFGFRILNEVATLFLVAIVFLAVLGKSGSLNYLYWGGGIVLFSLLIFFAAYRYKKKREG
ncbi:MAG: CopD family protein [Bacteroidota bacterium]